MKTMTKFFSIFMLFIMPVSCATAPLALPEKYNLDNQLEKVDQITTFSKPEWEEVDNQSIILNVNLNDYYLLILDRPLNSRILPITIGISSSISSISAGFDRIVVIDSGFVYYYTIEKIYRLKGREQANEIKKRLGEK